MKGGKAGRSRRPSNSSRSGGKGKGGGRGAPNKGAAKRTWSDAPKKGERPKPFGPSSSAGEE